MEMRMHCHEGENQKCTKTTTEPMRAECVHICSTVITKVRDAKWGPQTKANRYANSVIIYAKTQGSNW